MQFEAKAKYVRYSPYKLRPLADVIRGQQVINALNWLSTYRNKRTVPVIKVIESAVANAKHNNNIESNLLFIKEIRVDQGPIQSYFKPGAMGRAMPQRKRLCHLSVILEEKNK